MAAGYLSLMPYHTLGAARALVGAAWDGLDPRPTSADTQRGVVVRVMVGMYVIHGRVDFPRGYVQALQERMAAAGMRVPRGHTLRWYRSRLSEDPGSFERVPGIDLGVLDAIALRYGR